MPRHAVSWHVVFWYVVNKHRCVSGVIVSCVNALIHFPFTCLSLKPKTKHLVPVLVHVFLCANNATSGACYCTCVFACQQCSIWCLFRYRHFLFPRNAALYGACVTGVSIFNQARGISDLFFYLYLYVATSWASSSICVFVWPETQHLVPALLHTCLFGQKRGILNIF